MAPGFSLERTLPGAVVVMTGPSGAGKSTLVQAAQAALPELGFSVSHTTRGPRRGEVDGKDYHFVSVAEFQAELAAGGFVEHAEVHGNYYGTHKSVLAAARAEGRLLLLDIDVQGAEQLRDAGVADGYIFILPPSLDALEQRLRARATDSEETIAKRLANAQGEVNRSAWFDLMVLNDDREAAAIELIAALRSIRLQIQSSDLRTQLGLVNGGEDA